MESHKNAETSVVLPSGWSGVSVGNTTASRLRVIPPARLALRPLDTLAGSWKTQRPFALCRVRTSSSRSLWKLPLFVPAAFHFSPKERDEAVN
jgi:hypothetical protein